MTTVILLFLWLLLVRFLFFFVVVFVDLEIYYFWHPEKTLIAFKQGE